jgi:signal transduction histidine kinase
MVTSSWPRNRLTVVALSQAIAQALPQATVLFAVRVLDLERIAWREGRSRARLAERHAVAAFTRICLHALRASDAVAHEPNSDIFLAALLPRAGAAPDADLPRMARAVLSEIVRRFTDATGLALEWGWTVVDGSRPLDTELRSETHTALQRGRHERERYEFFATLGHEMRTPLMSISGYVQTLIERDLDRATATRFLETTQIEAMRLRRLVDSMYELSLMDLTEPLGSSVHCDVHTALERACEAMRPLAALRGSKIKLCGSVKRTMPFASERAAILFGNLIENAIKHGRPGGRIEVRAQDEGAWLTAFVDDDGAGVAVDERLRVFEQGARGSTTLAAGSGLGLAIVDGMLRRIGGDILIAESPLGGARFIVRVPLRDAPQAIGTRM